MSKQKITLQQYKSACNSVRGRIARLRKKSVRFRWYEENDSDHQQSPIAEIGVFDDQIDQMESILKSMQKRLDDAKITIKI